MIYFNTVDLILHIINYTIKLIMVGDRLRPPEILDILEIAVTIHHPETGAILGVNKTKEDLYGYSEDELMTMTIGDYSADDSKFTHKRGKQLIDAAADGTPQAFEWHVKRPNGELFWAHVQLRGCVIDGTHCVVATSQDISSIKEKERRLKLFYRIFRHNLRNDMNIILGYSERLAQAIEDSDLETQIQTVNDTAEKVASLSDSVKEIEQITNTTLADRSPTQVRSVVDNISALVKREYPAVTIAVEAPDDLWVNTDDNLQVALRQIVENAVEHNDRDRPTVLVTVTPATTGDKVSIEVADDGPGIPDIESIIFESEDKITSVSHNSGLGLWIIKFCAESLGGSVDVDTNEPRGSVVTLTLPLLSEI
jgi:PAS domain S-box-containing protein